MAELYLGHKKVKGVLPPGGTYTDLSNLKKFVGYRVTLLPGDTSRGNFSNCSYIKSAIVPRTVTEIPASCFLGCSKLENIKIEEGVTTIKEDAFQSCYSLRNLTLPSSITTIERGAFDYCSSLESITIPPSVNSIGMFCFGRCEALKTVIIKAGTSLSLGANCFGDSSNMTHVTEIYFEGDPPTVMFNSLEQASGATFYYKADNPNWTEELRSSNYGGATDITWVAY